MKDIIILISKLLSRYLNKISICSVPFEVHIEQGHRNLTSDCVADLYIKKRNCLEMYKYKVNKPLK